MDDNQRREIYEQKFEKYGVSKASELLEYLRLSNPLWATVRSLDNEWSRSWFFRGQGNADWDLIPAAWRQFGNSAVDLVKQDRHLLGKIQSDIESHKQPVLWGEPNWERIEYCAIQILTEFRIVREFVELADRLGHRIPSSNLPEIKQQTITQVIDQIMDPAQTTEDRRRLWSDPAIALAQHHRIPTRLLDWTQNPLVAAYFAATDALAHINDSTHFAIYALHSNHFRQRNVFDVVVPRNQNEFLRAQEGVFLVDVNADSYYIENGRYPDLMSSLFNIGEQPTKLFRPRKFVLPVEEAPELIRLLFLERVTRAHLMPTLDNVALTVQDKWRFVLSPKPCDDIEPEDE